MKKTLVLSHNWTTERIVPWTTAVSWLIAGRVTLVEEYDDPVKTQNGTYPRPAVVRHNGASKPKKNRDPKYKRRALWVRDLGCCQYCGINLTLKDATVDHVVPRAQGGKTIWENVVIACIKCNGKKADRTPEQANMPLLKKPYTPNLKIMTLETARCVLNGDPPENWIPWLYT
jgi:5-methylcytosine-specific restriction endonuclease McrA